jgi:hypothetical protein
MVKKLINDTNNKSDTVKSTYTEFQVPRTKWLSQHQTPNTTPRSSFNGLRPNFGQDTNVVCFYCNLPGHFAKYCPYSEQL